MGARPSQRDASVSRCWRRFCELQGLAPDPLDAGVAEAFVVVGLAGRAPGTKGTYRSALRRAAGGGRPALATPFSGSPAKAPYSAEETAELFAVAASQRAPWRRASALALLVLGLGAGLRPGELAAATGDDVVIGQSGVAVRVGLGSGRVVPVLGAYAKTLAHQANQAGPGYLFCPGEADRSYYNFVNNFCYHLQADPGAPRLCLRRARSSFICDHLAAGTPLRELLYISGISEVESLLRYARHVPGAPGSKAELRKRLRCG
jgi:integrase